MMHHLSAVRFLLVSFFSYYAIKSSAALPTAQPTPSQSPSVAPSSNPSFSSLSGPVFSTPGYYSFIIPPGAQSLVVDLYGAQGQDVPNAAAQSYGGKGAHVQMTVTRFRPSQTMYLIVGSRGGSYGNPGAAGTGSTCPLGAGGGGGYSALLESSNVIIGLAGGGGGGGDGNGDF